MNAAARGIIENIRAGLHRVRRNRHAKAALLSLALLTAALTLGPTLANAVAPSVSIEPAEDVKGTTALVKGTVDPEGIPTTYHFDYLTEEAYQAHADEVQSLAVSATAGTYTLSFEGQTSAPIAFDASAAEVEAALGALSTIGGVGGTLTASGGPGDESATTPYTLAFGGSLAQTDVGDISSDSSALTGGNASANLETPTQGRAPGFGGATEAGYGESESADPIELEAPLEGLSPATTYHLRLWAQNADGIETAEAPTFTTDAIAKPILSDLAVTELTDTGAKVTAKVQLTGTDPASTTTECRFYYVTDAQFNAPEGGGFESARSVPCDPDPIVGTEPDDEAQDVSAELTKLEPNQSYHLRLVAENAGGQSTLELEAPATFKTTAVGPTVATGTNTPLELGTTRVRAYVNPHNDPITSCVFEYGLTAALGQSIPCAGTPTTNNEAQEVSADISGLEPGALYHFQVKAANATDTTTSDPGVFGSFEEPEEESCPNEARREEQPSTFLPDCRAYEMVSPPDKNGGDVRPDSSRTRAAVQGGAVAYTSLSAFGDAAGPGTAPDYLAQRDAVPGTRGWSSKGLNPPHDAPPLKAVVAGNESAYVGFSPDLSKGIYRTFFPLTGDQMTEDVGNLYLREDLTNPTPAGYQLATACPACSTPLQLFASGAAQTPVFDGASADFGHTLFRSPFALTPDAPPPSDLCVTRGALCLQKTYEYDHGTIRLVGILPDGTPAKESLSGDSHDEYYKLNVISADGSKVFFSVPGSSDPSGTAQAYMRVGGNMTIRLAESERTVEDPRPIQDVEYENATPSGNFVYFRTTTALTDDAPTDFNSKLYSYDTTLPATNAHNLTLISADREMSDAADVRGVLGVSTNGAYVYFLAVGQLTAGRPAGQNGASVYLFHEGLVTYVGNIGGAGINEKINLPGQWGLTPLVSRVSPDGHRLVFMSTEGAGLTGYDHGTGCEFSHDKPCREIYLYDADTNSLVCASCRPDGVAAASDARDESREFGTGGATVSPYLSHPLSSDGHVFFSTGDPLVDSDLNGARDVYEYDSASGEVRLLSTGRSPADSFFLDATPDGKEVFFSTRERLLGWDADNAADLYTAREGGGFVEPPPVDSSVCSGETCLGTPTPPPPVPGSGSSTAAGPQDPKPKHKPKKKHRGKHRKHHHPKRDASHKKGVNR